MTNQAEPNLIEITRLDSLKRMDTKARGRISEPKKFNLKASSGI